jgi:hypothetical protein
MVLGINTQLVVTNLFGRCDLDGRHCNEYGEGNWQRRKLERLKEYWLVVESGSWLLNVSVYMNKVEGRAEFKNASTGIM